VLGACYLILAILCLLQSITKFLVERKLKTNVVFPAEIFILCVVRAALFFSLTTTWALRTPQAVSSAVFFVDVLPAMLFASIYLLLVASWGITWSKARRVRPFHMYQFWILYSVVSAVMFLVTVILSIVASEKRLSYHTVLEWEAYYLVVLCAACVSGALVFGTKLYKMLGQSLEISTYLSHVMRQLLWLLVIATASFAFKGVWVFSILTSVRDKWLAGEWSDSEFGAFWFAFYFVTELLPFSIVWWVLQKRDTNKKAMTHSAASSSSTEPLTRPIVMLSKEEEDALDDDHRQYDYRNADQITTA